MDSCIEESVVDDCVDKAADCDATVMRGRGKKKKKRKGFTRKRKCNKQPNEYPVVKRSKKSHLDSFGKDTGYFCVVCKTICYQGTDCERWKFCPACGTKFIPYSHDGYSKYSAMSDADLNLEAHRMNERSKLSKLISRHATPFGEPRNNMVDFLMRNRMNPEMPVSLGDKDSKKSRFCDVCGHKGTNLSCNTCASSFHSACISIPFFDTPERTWRCHSCLHEDARSHNRSIDICALRRDKKQTATKPEQCNSCGYHEFESLHCLSCFRWFCFACMCISQATIPESGWSCPECVGQEKYDEELKQQIAQSRQRLVNSEMRPTEQDGFSQLVFDLSCACSWEEFGRNIPVLIDLAQKQLTENSLPVILPFHSLHYPIDKDLMRKISESYAEDIKKKALKAYKRPGEEAITQYSQLQVWKHAHIAKDFFVDGDAEKRQRVPGSRLRIGYISSDFVNHPTADLIQSALIKHDRSKFEVFCYSITKDDKSEYRKRIKKDVEHFKNLSKRETDRKCAEAIAEDGIHVFINLNGHTAGDRNGISAIRPAPVQLVYLAYPGTMGAEYIDYNVVDSHVCPPEHRQHYTEKLLYMPHCYQANSFSDIYEDILVKPNLPSRADHQLPEDKFIFCNFCRLGRITDTLFNVWMRILRRAPNSILWLYKHPKAAVLRLQAECRKANIAHDRIVFCPPCSPKMEHLKRVTLADLCLDTLIYNGHTTGSDMLWAGVPMITKKGDNWPSLVATSLAMSVGMPEMIVDTLEQYEDLAVELATNKVMLQEWKDKLAKARLTQPLFDSERWIRSFEHGIELAWEQWERDDKPEAREDLRADDFGVSPSFRGLVDTYCNGNPPRPQPKPSSEEQLQKQQQQQQRQPQGQHPQLQQRRPSVSSSSPSPSPSPPPEDGDGETGAGAAAGRSGGHAGEGGAACTPSKEVRVGEGKGT